MTLRRSAALAAIPLLLAAGCREAPREGGTAPSADRGAAGIAPGGVASAGPGSGAQARFDGIGADETIRLAGTEPFWGATIAGGELVYTTPENQAGDTIAVRRFAGNNGLGFSGSWKGAAFDLTVTPGSCSDGMSERTYPFTATLRLGEEQRSGCAWTDRTPFAGPEAP